MYVPEKTSAISAAALVITNALQQEKGREYMSTHEVRGYLEEHPNILFIVLESILQNKPRRFASLMERVVKGGRIEENIKEKERGETARFKDMFAYLNHDLTLKPILLADLEEAIRKPHAARSGEAVASAIGLFVGAYLGGRGEYEWVEGFRSYFRENPEILLLILESARTNKFADFKRQMRMTETLVMDDELFVDLDEGNAAA